MNEEIREETGRYLEAHSQGFKRGESVAKDRLLIDLKDEKAKSWIAGFLEGLFFGLVGGGMFCFYLFAEKILR